MVARNLDRGSGFLRPMLDTAPFPNYFVVEPPIYESGVVVLKRADRIGPRRGRENLLGPGDGPGGVGSLHASAAARGGGCGLRGSGRICRLSSHDPLWTRLSTRRRSCWGPSSRDWPRGTNIDPSGDGTGSWRPGRSWRLGFAIKITAAFLLIPLLLVLARARSPRAILIVCSTVLARRCSGMRGPAICSHWAKARERRPTTDRSGWGSSGPPRSSSRRL